MNDVLVGNTKNAHLDRTFLCGHFCNRSAKTSEHAVLFGGDDGTRLAGSLQDSLLVERLERVHIEYTGTNALFGQHVGCLHTVSHGLATSDQGQVVAFAQSIGLAWNEFEIVVIIDIGHGIAANTHVSGFVVIDEELAQLAALTCIARQIDFDAREGSQHGDVVQAVMGGTQLTIGNTTAHANDLHRHLTISHIDLDLFQAAGYVETGGTEDEHLLTRRGEACRYAHRILLGDTHLHKLLG